MEGGSCVEKIFMSRCLPASKMSLNWKNSFLYALGKHKIILGFTCRDGDQQSQHLDLISDQLRD